MKEEERQHVEIDGIRLENVLNFVYLGSCFQSDGDDTADVKHRMNIAQSVFSDLHHLWRDTRLPTAMKVRIYQSAVCSSFTHACEAWDLNKAILKTINGFNSRCLSVITKGDIHELARDPPLNLVLTIRKRRLRYLGHILRMEPDRLVKRTLIALTKGGSVYPEGSLFMDVKDISFADLELLAKDKVRWSKLVDGLNYCS